MVNVTTERKNSRCISNHLPSAAACNVTRQRSCSIDARYYLGDPTLHVTGCISHDSAPYVQVVAAIKSDFAASLFRAALNQAGVFIRSTTAGACASSTWSWNMKHSSLPLSSLMNHTLQDRWMLFVVPGVCMGDFDSLFSDNLYAETWLQALAAHSARSTTASGSSQYLATPTRDAALVTLRTLLTQMGVDGGLFQQKDGRLRPSLTLPLLHLLHVTLLFHRYQRFFLQRLVALEPCVSCCHRRLLACTLLIVFVTFSLQPFSAI
jgi:hypothetical protein